MIHFSKLIRHGHGLAPVLLKRAIAITLDWDVRQKSRFDAVDSLGRTLGVFLPRGTAVRGGDVLVAEDGSLIRVLAAPQAVLVVRACAEHGSAFDLVRAAYHLGNRHVALELKPDHLKLEPDHVLADMLRAQHLIVSEALEAFEPEGGAYAASGHAHGHDHDAGHHHGHHTGPAAHVHGPDCDHGHHDHDHAHAQAAVAQPAAAPAHVHGADCGHDHVKAHGHGHGHGPGHDH